MNGRATLALLGVFVALGVYLFGFELPRRAALEAELERGKRVVGLTKDEIVRIDLPLGETSERTVLARAENGKDWRMESPRALLVDPFAVDGVLSALDQLQSELVLEPPQDRAQFELSDASPAVTVTGKSGEPITLRFGGDAPVGGQQYIESSARPGAVLVVRSATMATLRPDLYRLRDKSLVRIDPREVQSFQVELDSLRVAVARTDPAAQPAVDDKRFEGEGVWELREPIADRGDADRIFRFLQELFLARANAVIDDPGDLDPYGLAKPAARIRITPMEGEPVEIAMGRTREKVFARASDGPTVLELPTRVLDGMPLTLFDYRYKRVFSVRGVDVTRIELEFPREKQKHVFTRAAQDAEWKPESKEPPIDTYHVADLLYDLDFIDATSSIDDGALTALGLDPARVRVSVYDAAGKQLGWLALGDTTAEGVAARSSSSPRLWRVSADIGNTVPLGAAEFKKSWIADPSAPKVDPHGGMDIDALPPPPGGAP